MKGQGRAVWFWPVVLGVLVTVVVIVWALGN